MTGMPYIASELLEPHLLQIFLLPIHEMALMEEPPSREWFRDWYLRFQGVSYFLNDMEATHAILLWGQHTHDFYVAAEIQSPCAIPAQEGEAKRRMIWECAREAKDHVESAA